MAEEAPITPEEAEALLARGDAVLVDVRDRSSWAAAHPVPSRSIPIDELEDHVEELARARVVITTCGGGTRGTRAAVELRERGIEARALQGGLRRWRAEGRPVGGDEA